MRILITVLRLLKLTQAADYDKLHYAGLMQLSGSVGRAEEHEERALNSESLRP